nr:ATPase [Eubacterium sp.]
SLGAVKLGMDILLKDEKVSLERITGHGGLFTTKGVAQKYLSAAMDAPVTVMDTASEGGPWGMALLVAYMIDGKKEGSLQDYLSKRVFAGLEGTTLRADASEVAGFEAFADRYRQGLDIERSAIDNIG